jgi:hypothetical protein
MTTAPELLQLVLGEFQEALRANLQHPWGPSQGKPPKYGRVEQTEWTDDVIGKGKTLAAWRISPDTVRSSPVQEPRNPRIDGMFFDLLDGWFYFTDDLSAVFINWQTGPRFGKGFRHRIGQDAAGSYLLSRGTSTWVS